VASAVEPPAHDDVLVARQVVHGAGQYHAGLAAAAELLDQRLLLAAPVELPEAERDAGPERGRGAEGCPPGRAELAPRQAQRHDVRPVLAILVRPVPILPMLIKILIVATLAAIIASLASGLFHLVRDEGKSNRMVNALTVRITLSVLLFILLFVAWKGGLIQPRGLGR
jgi:hypothetical protein